MGSRRLCASTAMPFMSSIMEPRSVAGATSHPERVAALISQNGNAYLDGFSDEWGPWQAYWRDPNPENREAVITHPTLG